MFRLHSLALLALTTLPFSAGCLDCEADGTDATDPTTQVDPGTRTDTPVTDTGSTGTTPDDPPIAEILSVEVQEGSTWQALEIVCTPQRDGTERCETGSFIGSRFRFTARESEGDAYVWTFDRRGTGTDIYDVGEARVVEFEGSTVPTDCGGVSGPLLLQVYNEDDVLAEDMITLVLVDAPC